MRQRPEIKELARNAAAASGVSLSEWVAAAIAEKAGRPDLAPAKLRQGVIDLKLGA
ncbi:type II toxin -antitoxin system TacA 1-like antitoxin [Gordonia paraffinivorans]|uniref:type II toxin -antitoxin system TacA 1-like antitoxin n=1 Tax=Gordonia paraffinivorans TaxID=175628 RepID=UPI0035E3DE6D